ncbi:ABC transporter ATP-binding protein [Anaerolineales bacterium]
MIDVENLSKDFGDFRAVDSINFHVKEGEVLAMLGPNGAGKTTTVRMMTSIISPTAGRASVAGYDVVKNAEDVRRHVGVLTEQHGLYERMYGEEYLDFFGRIYHLDAKTRKERIHRLMHQFGLGNALQRRVGEYSKGMKQKLALVRAMLHEPPVLLLDEPTSAMDPQSAKQVRDAILTMQNDKRTFLITTHNLAEAQRLADRVAIIRGGRIIALGTIDELAQQFTGVPFFELEMTEVPQEKALEIMRNYGEIIEVRDTYIQLQIEDPGENNPRLLYQLLENDIKVVGLSRISESLESIYLRVVEDDANKRGDHELI